MNLSTTLHRFTVVPSLPKELAGLQRIAYNLWWSWEPEAIGLFKRLDPELWRLTRHNPLEVLGSLQQATLESLMSDEGFMTHLAQVEERLNEYLASRTWYQHHGNPGARISYFSMEK